MLSCTCKKSPNLVKLREGYLCKATFLPKGGDNLTYTFCIRRATGNKAAIQTSNKQHLTFYFTTVLYFHLIDRRTFPTTVSHDNINAILPLDLFNFTLTLKHLPRRYLIAGITTGLLQRLDQYTR